MKNILMICAAACVVLAGAGRSVSADESVPAEKWIPLFNGKDLTGWTPKFSRHPAGENYRNTFRVEDGLLKVDYSNYERFGGEFGHLFWHEKLSDYRLRVEYRFVGQQVAGGPGWALRNNGVMIHSEPPESMLQNQDFPTSIEVQLLGGSGAPRSTANVCTPGTHIVMDGRLITQHCTVSQSKTYDGDQWVTVEIEVRGNKSVRHIVQGETVLSYSQPQLDEGDANARRLLEQGAAKMLDSGYIAIQAETHPTEFRKIELLKLED